MRALWPIQIHRYPLFAALTVVLLSVAGPAQAHNVVDSRSPAPDSIVTQSPVEVSIATDDDFLDLGGKSRGFAIAVTDSAGLYFGNGCVDISERRMHSLVDLGEPGVYTITYQFVSADGHSVSESYGVTFSPENDHSVAVGTPSAPVCGVQNATPTEETQVAMTPVTMPVEDSRAPSAGIIGLGIGVAALALILAIFLARIRSRPTSRQ